MDNYILLRDKERYIAESKKAFIQCKATLKELSREETNLPYAPRYSELAVIATEEKWLEQRIENMQALRKGQDIDKIDVIARQLKLARQAQDIAEKTLNRLQESEEALTVKDAIALLKWGTYAEQLMMGINNNPMVRFRVDFGQMSDSDLDLIISANQSATQPSANDIISKALEKIQLDNKTIEVKAKPENPYGEYKL